MEKIRILHTGDLHLDSALTSFKEKGILRQHELNETFCKIIDIAKEKEVDVILITGDLFETSNPTRETMRLFNQKAKEILNIKIFLILGNHDYGVKFSDLSENIYLFNDELSMIDYKNVCFYGCNYTPNKRYNNLLNGFKALDETKINIILMHGDIYNQSSNTNPISLDDIKNTNADYLALGHIHTFDGFKKVGNTTYAYCGIPEGRGFDETNDKGIIIADVYKGYTKAEFIITSKRKCLELEINISDVKDYNECIDLIINNADDYQNIYKIILTGTPKENIDFMKVFDVLKEKYYYIKIIDETKGYKSYLDLENDNTLSGEFYRFVKANDLNENVLNYGLKALKGERIYINED